MNAAVKGVPKLALGASPRASLLPPEIKMEAGLRAQRRLLATIFIAVLVVVGAAYALASFVAQSAQDALDAANARTSAIVGEQSEYIEVRQLSNQVVAAEEARLAATATEVDWANYLPLVRQTIPAGSSITSLNVVSASPAVPLAAPSSPLETTRMVEIAIAVSMPTLPDISQWLDTVSTLPGYVDAVPGGIASSEGAFTVTLTVHVDESAKYNRFAPESEETE
jgi:hypothetical protein